MWFLSLCLIWSLQQRPTHSQIHNSYLPPAAPLAPIITKQFYSISPAEDLSDSPPQPKHLVIGQPRRNYRIIFIRAPTPEQDQVKYTAELAPQEERTVIYVLSRKPQELVAEDIVTPAPTESTQKPEIFFIKYKTNEEAVAAQREIQTQYDQLGGNTEYLSPQVAPVQSVIGKVGTTGYHYQSPLTAMVSTVLAPPPNPRYGGYLNI